MVLRLLVCLLGQNATTVARQKIIEQLAENIQAEWRELSQVEGLLIERTFVKALVIAAGDVQGPM